MNGEERYSIVTGKLNRAKKHLEDLCVEVHAFLGTNPYTVRGTRFMSSRRAVYKVSSIQPTPQTIHAISGDVLSNLRSSLDHLAYQLVIVGIGGKEPDRPNRIYFPIAQDERGFLDSFQRSTEGMRDDAKQAIRDLRPYGSNNLLWTLHNLNNIDKHRFVITAGASYDSFNIGTHMHAEMERDFGSPLPRVDLFLRPATSSFPLRVGTHLFTDVPNAPIKPMEFRFTLCLGEPNSSEGRPVIETLSAMVNLVESIFNDFKPLLI